MCIHNRDWALRQAPALVLGIAAAAAQKSVRKAGAIYDTAAISAKATDFVIFDLRRSSSCGRDCADGAVGTQTRESGLSLAIPVLLQLKNPLGEQELSTTPQELSTTPRPPVLRFLLGLRRSVSSCGRRQGLR
jgi:hypothetical protein